jgi:outer membrane receptor protein involved in Fe transport
MIVGPVSAATTTVQTIAQSSVTATVTGHVLDPNGAPLSGANVELSGNGTRTATTTGDDGSFTLTAAPGAYSLIVGKSGFRTEQTDLTLNAGVKLNADVNLSEANLQSLQIIGRVNRNTAANRAPFNISGIAVSPLPPVALSSNVSNNLTDIVATIPGVFAERTFSATPNTNFVVRGGAVQTRVTIDGHPVSSGIVGQWNTNYAISSIFAGAEAVKGMGLTGSIAGESPMGTVNLRTMDFTPQNTYGFKVGVDNWYGGQFYNAYASMNFFNNKASLILQQARLGYNGPWGGGKFLDRSGTLSPIVNSQYVVPSGLGLDQWQGDFSNNYGLQGQLIKARWKFSESTSLTGSFLGLQGQYAPQGGSYATYNGLVALQACQTNTSTSAPTFSGTLAGCTSQSKYTAPYTFPLVGTTVQSYTWFPSSFIQNNEPQFAAELRTTWKDDTLQFRPYTHVINRFISGAFENTYPGNGGAWYAVTNVANCQVKFLLPGTAGGPATGAAGPCFSNTMTPVSPSYVGADPTGFVPATTATAPACSPTPPFTCFTTPTSQQNNGIFGYSTPFSQPEIDRLNGYTFSWVHPLGENHQSALNFTVDYRKDYTASTSGDGTLPAPGCVYVIGSVTAAKVNDSNGVAFQPTCTAAQLTGPYAQYNILPRSPIGTPPTVSQYTDFGLSGTFQLGTKLLLGIGNYYEVYRLNAQIEDPTVLAAYAARGNSAASPVALIGANQTSSSYNPHVELSYRFNQNLNLRANAGSSITQPYPALVSGFGSISLPNAAAHNYTNTIPNFNLKPETTVGYNGGFDYRFGDGTVLSVDAYHNTIHNVFLQNNTTIAPVAGITVFPDTQFLQVNQINGPLQRTMGLEASLTQYPRVGIGYYVSATLQRAFYDQLPSSIYLSNTSPTTGSFNVTGAQIFGFPFFHSYNSVFYNGRLGEQYSLGLDWQGQNNSTLGPSYFVFDMSAKYPVSTRYPLFLQFSAQNLLYTTTGTALGRNLAGQGFVEPTAYLVPATGQVLIGGSATSVQALPPMTLRFSLIYGR